MVVVTQSESAATGRCQDTLVYSIDSSKLGYCNLLHYGTPNWTIYSQATHRQCRTVLHALYRNSIRFVVLNSLTSAEITALAWCLSGSVSNWQLWHTRYSLLLTWITPSTHFQSAFWFICVTTLIYLSSISVSTYSNRIRQLCFHFSCTSLWGSS